MGAIKNSIQNQIQDQNRTQFSDTTAVILDYDRTTETCQIKYSNPNGEGYLYRGNVPVANVAGGVSFGGIFPGLKCSISFINNNIYCPVIRGIQQSNYNSRNCTDQGAYIADDEVWKTGTPEHIVAMSLDWIDKDNSDLTKYENGGARYMDTDVNTVSMDMITTLDKFDNTEVGLTNLANQSTIKLRDNGDIDLFTSSNTGIRICKDGNIKLYGNDIEFTNSKTETTDKSISTQLKVAQIMKICLAYDIIKEVDEYVSAINESVESSIDLNGDLT